MLKARLNATKCSGNESENSGDVMCNLQMYDPQHLTEAGEVTQRVLMEERMLSTS